MEAFSDFFALISAGAQQNYVLVALFVLCYFVWPNMITRFFKFLEDLVNKVKFTVLGRQFDFSQTDVDEKINHFLRDWVISMYDKAVLIKGGVTSGSLQPDEAKDQLKGLTHEVVDYFLNKAPADLRKAAIDKFGGDKVLAAEFLFRRVQAIVHDEQSKKN